MATYTLYVDESGETGIKKVRDDDGPGASPYLTLGGVLIQDQHADALVLKLSEISTCVGSEFLHCNRLNHSSRVYYAREISNENITCFGLISYKKTLGEYRDAIANESVKYYNKCAMYLLERVGTYMRENNIPAENLRVIFEEGHFEYAPFRAYLNACQKNPYHENAQSLRRIDVSRVTAASKADEPLLQIADLVANSLFNCVNKSDHNYSIPETRYIRELKQKFYHHQESKKIVGYGIKAIHSLDKLDLDKEVHELLDNLEAHCLSV